MEAQTVVINCKNISKEDYEKMDLCAVDLIKTIKKYDLSADAEEFLLATLITSHRKACKQVASIKKLLSSVFDDKEQHHETV